MDKVYCYNCKYCKWVGYGPLGKYECAYPTNIECESSPLMTNKKYVKKIEELNANNSCPNYKPILLFKILSLFKFNKCN